MVSQLPLSQVRGWIFLLRYNCFIFFQITSILNWPSLLVNESMGFPIWLRYAMLDLAFPYIR